MRTVSQDIIDNVQHIISNYRKHITTDKRLVLLYWQIIDGVEMDKQTISTPDFLNKATSLEHIINAKMLIDITNKARRG